MFSADPGDTDVSNKNLSKGLYFQYHFRYGAVRTHSHCQKFRLDANQHTLTRRYSQKAVDFIHANRRRPFFLYLAHNLPHIPLYASEDHRGKSRRGIYGDVVEEIDAGVGEIVGGNRVYRGTPGEGYTAERWWPSFPLSNHSLNGS